MSVWDIGDIHLQCARTISVHSSTPMGYVFPVYNENRYPIWVESDLFAEFF